MARLGDAWIVLRAITDKLHGDVKDGLDSAAKDVEAEGNKAGASYGESFSKSAGKKIEEDVGVDIFNGMNDGFSDVLVDKHGNEKGTTWGRGFKGGFKAAFSDFGTYSSQIIDNGLTSSGTEKVVDDDGKAKGEHWIRSFKNVFSGSALDISARFKSAFPDSIAEEDGDKKGKSWAKGFLAGIGGGLAKVAPALTSALAPMLMIGGIAGLVGIAGGAITDLGAGLVALIGPLSQATTLLGVGFAAGIGALVQGAVIGKMFLNDLTASAKNVPPAAAAARKEFQDFNKSFKEMAATVGNQTVFPALQSMFHQLATGSLPLMKTAIQSTGQAFAGVINQLTGMLKNPVFSANLSTVFQTNATSIRNMGGAFLSLFQAMAAVLAVAAPLINQFTGWVGLLAKHAAASAEAAQKNGTMAASFSKAAEILKTLGSILGNIFGIFKELASAAEPLGEALLTRWADGTLQLKEYMKSAQGVKSLGNFFDPNGAMAANLHSIGDLIGPLLTGLADLATAPGIRQLSIGIQEALPAVTVVLVNAANAVGRLGKALGDQLVSPAGIKGVNDLDQGISNLGGALQVLATVVGPVFSVVGDLVSSFSTSFTPALTGAAAAITSMEGPTTQVGNFLGNVLGAAFKAVEQALPPIISGIGTLADAFSGPLSTAVSVVGTALRVIGDIFQFLAPIVGALAPELTTLAVAFVAMKVAAAASSLLKGWATGLGDIGVNAALAIQGLTGSEAAGMKAVSAFGAVESGISGAAKAASGLASALPIVGAVVAAVAVPFVDWISNMIAADNAAIQVKVSTDGLVSSLQASQGAITGNVTAAAALAAQQAGLFTAAGQWGISTGTITAAMLGSKTAMDDAKAAAASYKHQLDLTGAGSAAVAKNDSYIKALETTAATTQTTITAQEQLKGAIAQANGPAGDNASRLQGISDSAGSASTQVNQLAAALANLTGDTVSTVQANANFKQAVDSAVSGMKQFHGAAVTLDSVLNSTTPAGAAAAQALISIGKSGQNVIASMEHTGASTEATIAKANSLRTAFINAAKGMGITATDAGALADKLFGIPSEINTEVKADTTDAAAKAKAIKDNLHNVNGIVAQPKVTLTGVPSIKGSIADIVTGLDLINGKKPTPTAHLDPGPFSSVFGNIMGNIGQLGNQNPTPIANLNPAPLDAAFGQAMGSLLLLGQQTPSPTANLIDHASGTAAAIANQINGLHDKSITVTTYYNQVGQGQVTGSHATGGEVTSNEWATVGEHGRELLFLTKGQYVATYQQAQTILAAANAESQRQARAMASIGADNSAMQALQITSNARKSAASVLLGGSSSGSSDSPPSSPPNINMPITVNPSAQMDEMALARQVGFEVGYQLRRV